MNKYSEICEKKVRLRDGSVHSVTGKPEAYAVSPKISEQDELTAVCIDAEIQTQATSAIVLVEVVPEEEKEEKTEQ